MRFQKTSKDSMKPWLPCQDPSDDIPTKSIEQKHQMSQFQDKGNQKSQVFKVSKEKHYKLGLGMKLFQIKVIKAQSPSIYPHCASKTLAREVGREFE